VTDVIDWGDLCHSDPGIDLQLLWSFLPAVARPAFLDAYGSLNDEQLLRAGCLRSLSARYSRSTRMPRISRT
jgi:hypothetical protein